MFQLTDRFVRFLFLFEGTAWLVLFSLGGVITATEKPTTPMIRGKRIILSPEKRFLDSSSSCSG